MNYPRCNNKLMKWRWLQQWNIGTNCMNTTCSMLTHRREKQNRMNAEHANRWLLFATTWIWCNLWTERMLEHEGADSVWYNIVLHQWTPLFNILCNSSSTYSLFIFQPFAYFHRSNGCMFTNFGNISSVYLECRRSVRWSSILCMEIIWNKPQNVRNILFWRAVIPILSSLWAHDRQIIYYSWCRENATMLLQLKPKNILLIFWCIAPNTLSFETALISSTLFTCNNGLFFRFCIFDALFLHHYLKSVAFIAFFIT